MRIQTVPATLEGSFVATYKTIHILSIQSVNAPYYISEKKVTFIAVCSLLFTQMS